MTLAPTVTRLQLSQALRSAAVQTALDVESTRALLDWADEAHSFLFHRYEEPSTGERCPFAIVFDVTRESDWTPARFAALRFDNVLEILEPTLKGYVGRVDVREGEPFGTPDEQAAALAPWLETPEEVASPARSDAAAGSSPDGAQSGVARTEGVG